MLSPRNTILFCYMAKKSYAPTGVLLLLSTVFKKHVLKSEGEEEEEVEIVCESHVLNSRVIG